MLNNGRGSAIRQVCRFLADVAILANVANLAMIAILAIFFVRLPLFGVVCECFFEFTHNDSFQFTRFEDSEPRTV